jgi:dipeptidyl aminopeptidase/acylaminoacyl peptidase
MRRIIFTLLSGLGLVITIGLMVTIVAQTKAPVPPADYGQWETLLTVGSRGGLSPDGKWLAYGINRSSRNNELRITSVADGTTKIAAFGAQPVFSSDSRWVAYGIGYPEAQEEKLRKDKKPIHRKLGLVNLSNGEQTTIEGIESFAFSPTGAYLAMRRYAPEKKETPEASSISEADETPGATLIVRDLATGRDTTFGNVAEFAWQDLANRGRLLALTISAEDKTGNGVQLFDPETGALRVLDSSASTYSGLAWRKDSADLTVLRSKVDERHDGPTQIVLAWRSLAEASEIRKMYDPTADAKFPSGLRTVAFRKPSWSVDGKIVFLGVAKWSEKRAEAKKNAAAGGDGKESDTQAPSKKDATNDTAKDEDEPAAVDVWHARDIDVMPKQKLSAKNDRQRNFLSAWHIETGQFVQLGSALEEQVTPIKHQNLAFATNWSAYAMDRSIGRPAADLYLIDLASGARTKIKERLIEDHYVQVSPGGRYLLYVQDDHYWTIDVATRAVVNITKSVQATFVDRESDFTIKQKPAFGVAGWTKNDESVILYDKFDLWRVAPDGSKAVRLTDGAAGQVRHRYVRLNQDEEWIDTDKPVYLSLFGIWTKKAGYARLRPAPEGATVDEHLVWLDKSVQRLSKAKNSDVYGYVIEAYDDSPDAFVAGPDLKEAKQVTRTNPFQSNYAWGRAELVEYKNDRGERLQGALFYPAGYEPGKKYPMIVYIYERLSEGLHRYSAPSERDYYNSAAFTQHGYFLFQPDISFRPREPGISVAECVTPAVKKIVQMGLVDSRKIGVVGHSWGGFDTTYLATHTDVFAAAVAGAPITDLISNYGNHHWSSGIAETDHIETGQQRMEVPLWEDLQAYIRNSAVFNVQNMKTPLMIEVGDSDGTVFWHQGVELYNIARRAKKDVVLLVYTGEDHGLRKKANQIDYHRRILEWFGHYLKDEPGPSWITSGVTFLEREQELKELKMRKGKN